MSSQVPQAGEFTVDHIAHFVPDIGTALEALGFTLTPFSQQSHRLSAGGPLVPAGTGNRCVMLKRGYLEILTPTADTPVANQLRAAIQRYPGVHLIAFGSAAPDLDYARLEKLGYEPLTPVALQRPISTASGEETARFTVVRVPPGKMPKAASSSASNIRRSSCGRGGGSSTVTARSGSRRSCSASKTPTRRRSATAPIPACPRPRTAPRAIPDRARHARIRRSRHACARAGLERAGAAVDRGLRTRKP